MRYSDVKIESPCTEKLEKIKGGCGAYFCASCDKAIYDFRDVTEAEFGARLDEMGQEKCGIFYMDQINPEVYRNSVTPRLLAFVLSCLALIGISSTGAKAQGEQKPEVENIVRDRSSHGIIPRYGLKIEPEKVVKKGGTITVAEEKPKEEEPVYKRKTKRRKFLGIIPLRRRHVRGRMRYSKQLSSW